MKYYFSIDALPASGHAAWRLQIDGVTWRDAVFAEPLQANDYRIFEPSKATIWHGRRLKQVKGQLQVQPKPGRFDFLTRGIFSHAVLHRCSVAAIPDLTQMQDVIRQHAPHTAWLLYLNIAGQFMMLDTQVMPIIGNLSIAVRGEIASSSAYIGALAADNKTLVRGLFHQFLAGWWQHLNTSRMGVFVPDVSTLRPLEEYIAHIDGWEAESFS
ncbi:MAG: hypothetical protein Q9M22_05385 [Mariprofundaceae bacterium]|nr:hypothetical protein [Mariprofundaceae bacterium]